MEKSEGPLAVNGQYPLPDNLQPVEDAPKSTTEDSQDGDSSGGQLGSDDLSLQTSSRKIEVPNNKVILVCFLFLVQCDYLPTMVKPGRGLSILSDSYLSLAAYRYESV